MKRKNKHPDLLGVFREVPSRKTLRPRSYFSIGSEDVNRVTALRPKNILGLHEQISVNWKPTDLTPAFKRLFAILLSPKGEVKDGD